VLLLFGVNPLLRSLGARWPLRAAELGVIVALGMAACGWPGSNFFRGFTTVTAYPAHWLKTKPNWQSPTSCPTFQAVRPELAQGHVQDWKRLGLRARKGPRPGRTFGSGTIVVALVTDCTAELPRGTAEGLRMPARTAELGGRR